MKEAIRVVARDGYMLSATWYVADNPDEKVVLINSATGVKQSFYRDFAAFLSKQGINVYTFDYRGIGDSRPENLSSLQSDMKDWARDVDGMIAHITHVHPRSHFIILGHSIGGQLIGMSSLASQADAVIMVASQTPFWKVYPGAWMKTKLLLFWYLVIPLFTRLFGYFPASRLWLFEDLPPQVALQWARWAKSPNYIFDELPGLRNAFAALDQPALMISFADDILAPSPAVLDLKQYYSGLKIDHRHYEPDDLAQQDIGHFGFFKKKSTSALWREIELWIQQLFPSGRTKVA
jgi:predicted alpha/beta hydrolase